MIERTAVNKQYILEITDTIKLYWNIGLGYLNDEGRSATDDLVGYLSERTILYAHDL